MEFGLDLVRQLHPFYWKNSIYFGIYLGCLLVLFLFRKKEGWKSAYRSVFWYTIVALIIVCYNPLFIAWAYRRLFWYDMSTCVRVFLILPLFFTVAYVITGLISGLPRVVGDLVLCGVVALIIITGETPSKHEMYRTSENPFKINTEAIQLSDMIDAQLEEGKRCYVSIPAQYDEIYGTGLVWQGIRQYDSNIIIDTSFPVMVTEEQIDSGEFEQSIRKIEKDLRDLSEEERQVYLICLKEKPVLEALESYGYHSIGETDTFSVMSQEGSKT